MTIYDQTNGHEMKPTLRVHIPVFGRLSLTFNINL